MPRSTFDFFTGEDPTQYVPSVECIGGSTDSRSWCQWHGQVSFSLTRRPHTSHLRSPACSYTDRATALANNLVYVTEDGKVIMKGDNTTSLASGVYRNRSVPDARCVDTHIHAPYVISVRISSQKQYNTGKQAFESRIRVVC